MAAKPGNNKGNEDIGCSVKAPPAVPKRSQGMKVRRDGTPEVTAARCVGIEQGMKE